MSLRVHHEALIYDGVVLGEGLFAIDPAAPFSSLGEDLPGTPTGNVCVSTQGLVEEVSDRLSFEAFTLHHTDYLTPKLNRHMRGDIEPGAYQDEIAQALEPMFATGEREVVVILATIPTTSRYLSGDVTQFPDSSICHASSGQQPSSLEAFFDACGQQFLKREERAINVMLHADVSALTEAQRVEIGQRLGVNTIGQALELDVVMKDLANVGGLSFTVTPLTEAQDPINRPLTPDAEVLTSGGELLPDKWDDYRDQLRAYFADPSTGALTDALFGEVVEQEFANYDGAFLAACGQSLPAYELSCYYSFVEEATLFHHGRSRILREKARLSWMLANKDRVEWSASNPVSCDDPEPDDPSEGCDAVESDHTRTRYGAVVSKIGACVYEWDQAMQQCATIFEYGGQITCNNPVDGDPCVKPECSVEQLERQLEALPRAEVLPPGVTANQQRGRLSESLVSPIAGTTEIGFDASQAVCVLSRTSGYFAGTGEEASLSLTEGGATWRLKVRTDRSEDDEQPLAGAICVPHGYFVDTSGLSGFHQQGDDAVARGEVGTSQASSASFAGRRHAAAVNGMTGRMAGGGEVTRVDPNSRGDWVYTIATQRGYLRGFVSAFGPLAPRDNVAQYVSFSGQREYDIRVENEYSKSGEVEMNLAAVDDAMCFLTELRGQFDGRGESVSLFQRERFWVLRAKSTCKERSGLFGGGDCERWKPITASARCLKYDQR